MIKGHDPGGDLGWLEQLPVMAVVLDAAGILVRVNERFAAFVGSSRAAIEGRPYVGQPWASADAEAVRTELAPRFERGEDASVIGEIRRHDGEYRWTEWSLSHLPAPAGGSWMLGVGADATETRFAELVSRLLLRLADMEAVVPAEALIGALEAAVADAFGFDRATVVTNADGAVALGGEREAADADVAARALRAGGTAWCDSGTGRYAVELPGWRPGRAALVLAGGSRPAPQGWLLARLPVIARILGERLGRWRADQAAAASERRHRELLDSLQEVVFKVGFDGRWRFLSPAWEGLAGRSVADSLGRPWWEDWHPDDREALRARLATAQAGEQPAGLLARIRGLDGAWRWTRARLSVHHDPAGAALGMQGTLVDTTEQVLAERALASSVARFRAFMAHSPTVAFIKDAEGRYLFANAAFERLVGRAIEPPMADTEVVPAGQLEAVRKLDREVLLQNRSREDVIVFEHPDAPPTAWLLLRFPIEDENGARLLGAISIDITERRRLEALKDDFLAMVSHELRTPLTGMRGALGMLTAGMLGPLAPDVAEMVEVAAGCTDRLIRMTNDFLDFSRLADGHLAFRLQRCMPGPLIDGAVATMKPLADASLVRVEAGGEAVAVLADPDRVTQILLNLLSNAIKFSPPAGTIAVRWARRGDRLRIEVSDEGPGVTAGYRTLIFERFGQAGANDAQLRGGVGLGLAICKLIAEQGGGEIGYDPRPEGGSCFWFTLPASG